MDIGSDHGVKTLIPQFFGAKVLGGIFVLDTIYAHLRFAVG